MDGGQCVEASMMVAETEIGERACSAGDVRLWAPERIIGVRVVRQDGLNSDYERAVTGA
jgi:hypothetical protein